MPMAKADCRVSFILPGPLLSLDTPLARNAVTGVGPSTASAGWGPDMAADIRSGGTIYSTTDGPGGPILRGGHPRRDRPMVIMIY